MLDQKYIKPIPQRIAKQIRYKDEHSGNYTNVRFYAYFAKIKGELVKITVACKNYKKQWFCKQVAIHGVHSEKCLVRDIDYTIMGYQVGWYSHGLAKEPSRFDDYKWYSVDDKYYNPCAIVINRKYALKFDAFKYSAIDKYPYCDELKYLRIYEQYPQAEYFIKIGLQHLATNKTLLKKAGKDKNFRKWLIQNARQLRNEHGYYPCFSSQTILASYKANVSILKGAMEEKEKREMLRNYSYTNTISKVIPKDEISTFIKYIHKQNTNVSSYADYIKACEYLNLDMSLPKNRYPHDFKRWHDIRIDEYNTAKAIADEKQKQEMYAKFAIVSEKYLSLQRNLKDAFIVLIARTPKDLIHEGDYLHHCVGRMNYDQRVIREESLIFFIRNKDNPDIPFVTVEYSLKQHKVLQCYGDKDTKPAAHVLDFVHKKWLPYANRKLKQLNKIVA